MTKGIIIPALCFDTGYFTIRGTSPLIWHNWVTPQGTWKDRIGWRDGKPVIPTYAVKASLVSAYNAFKPEPGDCYTGMVKRGALKPEEVPSHVLRTNEVLSALHQYHDYVVVEGEPERHIDNLGRECVQFDEWCLTVPFSFRTDVLTHGFIAAWLNVAGFGRGLGMDRPEKDGSHGMYEVVR